MVMTGVGSGSLQSHRSAQVLDVGGRGELTPGGNAVCKPALEEERLELCTSCVDGRGVRCRATPYDANLCVRQVAFGPHRSQRCEPAKT